MKRALIVVVVVAALFAAASPGFAQKTGMGKPDGDKPGFVAVNLSVVKASVEDIDKQSRMITLKGPRGNLVTLKAGEEIVNFDQINKGDDVVARYYESVAIIVDAVKGAQPRARESEMVEIAPRGAKPARTMVNTKELTAVVDKINYKKRAVTLKLPEGKVFTVKVDPSVKKFKEIKKGDEIYVRHTEALALSVEKR
jgi:hypothetical protein